MSKTHTYSVVPRGMGYSIERRKADAHEVLWHDGKAFKFNNRSNADAYVRLAQEDHTLIRNDFWLAVPPQRTVYQGGSLAPSIRHQYA